jgi:Rrf2 family protein
MHVSARVDYGTRALVELAEAWQRDPRGLTKGDALAAAQDIPVKFLEGILRQLRQAGIVASQRGAEGGYRLDRDPGEVTIADVVRALDGPLAAVRDLRPEDVHYEGVGGTTRREARCPRAHDDRRCTYRAFPTGGEGLLGRARRMAASLGNFARVLLRAFRPPTDHRPQVTSSVMDVHPTLCDLVRNLIHACCDISRIQPAAHYAGQGRGNFLSSPLPSPTHQLAVPCGPTLVFIDCFSHLGYTFSGTGNRGQHRWLPVLAFGRILHRQRDHLT